jgi:nitroreductase
MSLKEAIDTRISIRKFNDLPIEIDKLKEVNDLIKQYNEFPGIRFELINDKNAFSTFTESYGLFENVNTFIVAIRELDSDNSEEKLGYFGENLVLTAVANGLGTCWVGVRDDLIGLDYYDLIPDEYKNKKNPTVTLKDNEEICCLIALGNIDIEEEELKILSNKRGSKNYDELTYVTSYAPLEEEWFKNGIKAVLKAPSAFNMQPIRFVYDKNMVYAEIVNKQATMVDVDLGIAKLHFQIGAECGSWQWGNQGVFNK